jgi:plastocyanin
VAKKLAKKQKKMAKGSPISKFTIISIAVIALAVVVLSAYLWYSAIPVNSKTPIFGTAENIYILAVHTDQGYAYDEQSTKTGKKAISGTNYDPSIHIQKGSLVSFHVINEDKDTGSDQDLNIDAFNVHTSHLKYFQAQTINFLADKEGTFSYYSTIHPEMKGSITVDP